MLQRRTCCSGLRHSTPWNEHWGRNKFSTINPRAFKFYVSVSQCKHVFRFNINSQLVVRLIPRQTSINFYRRAFVTLCQNLTNRIITILRLRSPSIPIEIAPTAISTQSFYQNRIELSFNISFLFGLRSSPLVDVRGRQVALNYIKIFCASLFQNSWTKFNFYWMDGNKGRTEEAKCYVF